MESASKRYAACFSLLAALLLSLFALNLFFGSIKVSAAEFLQIISGNNDNVTAAGIINGIRLPRALAAALLGGALSVSGFLLQTFFNNPIAGPFILGISSGAKMTVAFAMIIFLGAGKAMSSAALITAAFAGPVSFVGIAVPHLVKSLFGTAKPQVIIPASFLGGAAFCLFSDLVARTVFAPSELILIANQNIDKIQSLPVILFIVSTAKEQMVLQSLSTTFSRV